MKIAIAEKDGVIYVNHDFGNPDSGLIGQTICELEILKTKLIELYIEDEK